jgi:hypothetical protein
MNSDRCDANVTRRWEFISRFPLALAGSVLAIGTASRAAEAPRAVTDSPASPLPTIRLGDHQVTRLIAGSNPINGYSYLGPIMDRHMREYFTAERIVEFLSNCERAGINTHQFRNLEQMTAVFQTLREQGSKMKFICLHAGGPQSASILPVD